MRKDRPNFSWLENFDVTQLLHSMKNDCDKIAHAGERAILQEQLMKLVKESKRPLAQRDLKEIVFIWRRIHPELKYYGILNPYAAEPMKSRILNFLKGKPIELKFHDNA